jgi:hypothetical protein
MSAVYSAFDRVHGGHTACSLVLQVLQRVPWFVVGKTAGWEKGASARWTLQTLLPTL